MFFYNHVFNGDISNWDTRKATDMSYMFNDSVFTGDISNWNISNVVKMERMFQQS
jgi:surface protein